MKLQRIKLAIEFGDVAVMGISMSLDIEQAGSIKESS